MNIKCPICLNDKEYTRFFKCNCGKFECHSNKKAEILEFSFSVVMEDTDLILKVHGRNSSKTTIIGLYKNTMMVLPIPDAKGNKISIPSVVKVYSSQVPVQFTIKPDDNLQEQVIEIVKTCGKYIKLEKFS